MYGQAIGACNTGGAIGQMNTLSKPERMPVEKTLHQSLATVKTLNQRLSSLRDRMENMGQSAVKDGPPVSQPSLMDLPHFINCELDMCHTFLTQIEKLVFG